MCISKNQKRQTTGRIVSRRRFLVEIVKKNVKYLSPNRTAHVLKLFKGIDIYHIPRNLYVFLMKLYSDIIGKS